MIIIFICLQFLSFVFCIIISNILIGMPNNIIHEKDNNNTKIITMEYYDYQNEYPENECRFCGEPCEKTYCNKQCERADED